ncbi:XRE family transcriptional regulator [Microbacterium sp. NPDC096154]|uniref:helix-turn-helix domain-containing protein n=1 Tax=Microbacterium sp. NPDC096154 TaxID=3155549 RepID=UPI003332E4D1
MTTDSAELGATLRRLRRGARLTLRDLSGRTGLSESFISQFERGHTQASISSLALLAEALEVRLDDVFSPSGGYRTITRGATRPAVPFGHRATRSSTTSAGFGSFEVFHVVLEPEGAAGSGDYAPAHEADVHVLVEEGRVSLDLGGEAIELGPGDAVTFDAATPHRFANAAAGITTTLWVISPAGPPSDEGSRST